MNSVFEFQCADIWQTYEPYIRTLCKIKLRDHSDDIDEVVADTFLALCEMVSTHGMPENPKAWLFGTAIHKIKGKYRQVNKSNHMAERFADKEYALSFDVMTDPAEITENKLWIEHLQGKLIAQLSADEIELLDLIYKQNLKMKDIAFMKNSTESAVKQKSYRIHKKLRQLVKEFKDDSDSR